MENSAKSDEEGGFMNNSISFDGYERLHDDLMDNASVSIHYSDFSDFDDAFNISRTNSVIFNEVKKIKISLSQEQLKLNCEVDKNHLNVPKAKSFHRIRTSSPSAATTSNSMEDKNEEFLPPPPLCLFEKPESYHEITSLFPEHPQKSVSNNSILYDEIFYAIPNKAPSSSKSYEHDVIAEEIERFPPPQSFEYHHMNFGISRGSFRYPFSFYCQICNNILQDPRILDCLHSFCVKCLVKIDASNNLENNQFWRKISDASSKFWIWQIKKYQIFHDSISLSISRPQITSTLPHLFHVRASNPIPLRKQNSHFHQHRIWERRSSSENEYEKIIYRRRMWVGGGEFWSIFSSSSSFCVSQSPSTKSTMRGRQSSIISFSEKRGIICPTCCALTEMTNSHGEWEEERSMNKR